MAGRNAGHMLLQHMREVSDITGFGSGIPLENLVEAMGWTTDTVHQILLLLRERGYVHAVRPAHYDSEWWIAARGLDVLEALEFFGY